MEYVRQTVSGAELNNLIKLPPMLRNSQVEVIVLPVVNSVVAKKQKPKRQIGFAKGADIPDSFFEPLSEEELQAWGL